MSIDSVKIDNLEVHEGDEVYVYRINWDDLTYVVLKLRVAIVLRGWDFFAKKETNSFIADDENLSHFCFSNAFKTEEEAIAEGERFMRNYLNNIAMDYIKTGLEKMESISTIKYNKRPLSTWQAKEADNK